MLTDLFAAASGWSAAEVTAAVPPPCRRPILPPPAAVFDTGGARLDVEWRPRGSVRHLVPAFGVADDADYSVRFELSVRCGGEWSPWIGGAPLGSARFDPIAARTEALAAEIDVFVAGAPVEAVRLTVRLRAEAPRRLLAAPWLVTLSACDLARPAPAEAPAASGVRLPVAPRSQMEEAPDVRHRICSPASVAMVLAYWGAPVEVAPLAAEIFHPALDLYGVWPAAIRAAARRGVAGYLLRFPDWAAAAWCMAQGMPIIASVRYGAGELTGAAIAETPGHLIVLTGYEGADVLVNDPAAPTAAAVARRYPLDQIRRVWLERAGVGYVLFRPAVARRA